MALSPENYIGLEKRCIKLLEDIKGIIDGVSKDEPEVELKAVIIYDQMISIEAELNIAIKNSKNDDTVKKYQQYFNEISSFNYAIHMIAHIM